MRHAKFLIESLPNRIFEGFTRDEDWNCWACPYFTFEEGNKILEAHISNGVNTGFDEDSNSFVFEIQGEDEYYSAVTEDGRKLYPIGNSAWIWEEV